MEDAFATRLESVESCLIRDVSFFQKIDDLWIGELCPRYPLHRFFTLMRKMQARSFVTEELTLNEELKEERDMATRRCGGRVEVERATRLTFFASSPRSGEWYGKNTLHDAELLGYAVVVSLRLPNDEVNTFLLEAVTKGHVVTYEVEIESSRRTFPFEVPNCYIHNCRDHLTRLGPETHSQPFVVKGTFFTQQNNLTSICAHAALRMAINSSPLLVAKLQDKLGVNKLRNKHINDLLGIDFGSPKSTVGHYAKDPKDPDTKPKEGLDHSEIRKVVNELGMGLLSASFIEDSSVEYDEVLYPVMESGYPVILEVQGWHIKEKREYVHGVAVAGHWLNTDRWEPEALWGYGNYPIREYIPACQWVCHYIMSDDNFGMDVALPSRMVRNEVVPVKNPKPHATSVLAILPEEVTILGKAAEKIAMEIAVRNIVKTDLDPRPYWLDILKKRHDSRSLVCRTILLRGEEYRTYITEQTRRRLFRPTRLQMSYLSSLPEYIWVSEITTPNLYAGNKTKLGDVIIDAAATEKSIKDYDCFLLAWFPGFLRAGRKPDSELWHFVRHVPLIAIQDKPLYW